jgi:hypothetical protein
MFHPLKNDFNMTNHHNVVAERLADEIDEKISDFTNVDRISIMNELLDRIDEKLRQAMQQEYNTTDDDWE